MTDKSPRWTGIEARGKNIVLLNGTGFWCAVTAETPAIAEHVVREIESLINSKSRQAVSDATYNRLCRAGD